MVNCVFNICFSYLGASNPIILSDTDDDNDFAGFKKKGHKIIFSDDDDDNFLQPKTPTSKGR